MKNQRMSVKRRTVRKGALRTLFANVMRKNKNHRAATAVPTADDFEDDVPNVGIGRALLVILIIHVIAIGGIFYHSHRVEKKNEATVDNALPARVVTPARPLTTTADTRSDEEAPQLRQGDQHYTVGTGETYASIAASFGIDEMELRSTNRRTELRQGDRLVIPPRAITALESPEIAQLRMAPATPAAPVEAPTTLAEGPAAGLMPTEAALEVDALAADPAPAAAEPAAAPVQAEASAYTVKSGDTFWGIAKKHGTTVDALMKLNGITDARKLRAGMSLKIP
jgi:LysM repeat protein